MIDMDIYKTAEEEGIITFMKDGIEFEVNGMLKNKWYSYVYKAQKYAVRLSINDILQIIEME